jgi:hypothetical protein
MRFTNGLSRFDGLPFVNYQLERNGGLESGLARNRAGSRDCLELGDGASRFDSSCEIRELVQGSYPE